MQSGISTDKWSVRHKWLGALSGTLLAFVGRQRREFSLSQNEGPDRILSARRRMRVGSIRGTRNAVGDTMQTGYYGSGIEMWNIYSLLYRAVAAFVLLLLAPALWGQGVSGRIIGNGAG